MTSLQTLAEELAITIGSGEVWLSIGLALLLGGLCLVVGIGVTRTVGLLERNAPAGETLGVGLGAGLMIVSAWWAAIWSGGRSSFTPVAIGFALAIGLALARRVRRPPGADGLQHQVTDAHGIAPGDAAPRRMAHLMTIVAGGAFIVAVALLYGSTMAPSPRNGQQPVEFVDEAFYAVLGRDLASAGTETNLSASGFSEVAGLPTQTWYHWGELWLAAIVVKLFGAEPLAARYFVVLPVALLAAAALTGTLVRRIGGTTSWQAYAFGFLTCLFLAPVIPGPFLSAWAVGMIFGITLYGLGAVAFLLALYGVAVLDRREPSWALVCFVASVVAFIVPSHVVVAFLTLVGVASVWAVTVWDSLRATRRLPVAGQAWWRTLGASAVLVIATLIWGLFTSHGLAVGDAPHVVSPFSGSWRDAVTITIIGAGMFVAIPVALLRVRPGTPFEGKLYFGTLVLLVVGAIAWGARLGDFTMFYVYFAGIAVIATPVAAIAARSLWERLRATQHLRLAAALAALCIIQLEFGVVAGVLRMQSFGPIDYPPIPESLIAAINQLPGDSKLAYACRPLEEVGFGTPRLLSIDAHTSRRVVPMCFEAEVLSTVLGAPASEEMENLSFRRAPQRILYPDANARPSSDAVAAFLKLHGIDFIYADARHPNSLVAGAVPIATSGDAQLLRVP